MDQGTALSALKVQFSTILYYTIQHNIILLERCGVFSIYFLYFTVFEENPSIDNTD